jgi:putative holliday junction resolvase
MKILAIDYGDARIGLAISDDNKILALPLATIKAGKTIDLSVDNVIDYITPRLSEIEAVVVGLPLHMNGKESPMSTKAREFAKNLEEKLSIKVDLLDERLSSAYITSSLKEINMNRKKRSKIIDSAAASAILQNYMERLKNLS